MAKREDLAGRISLVVLMATGMTACVSRAGLESASVAPDPDTEIGRAMIEATRNPGPYPQFSDIPKVPAAPTTARTDGQSQLAAERDTFAAQLAALPPAGQALTETEAARLRALIAIAPPPANSAAETEAYARAMRQRAKPPPAPR